MQAHTEHGSIGRTMQAGRFELTRRFMTEQPDHLHINFQQAFNRADLDAIVALYEPGAVLVSGDGPAQGRDAIREVYRRVLAMRPTILVQTLAVNRAGDLAMLHGKWILDGTAPDGGPIRREVGIQRSLACSRMAAGYS